MMIAKANLFGQQSVCRPTDPQKTAAKPTIPIHEALDRVLSTGAIWMKETAN
jgi:hypothetical protein